MTDADRLRAQIPSSTDPARLERMAHQAERRDLKTCLQCYGTGEHEGTCKRCLGTGRVEKEVACPE